ncbi:MAG TPA: aminotransferase, partial [Planctomycetes bacterium]|nr:aminotransferase [Planctomycetota bacterium]
MTKPSPSPFARHWDLDPEVVFLNHGSFGACPRVFGKRFLVYAQSIQKDPPIELVGQSL